MDDSDEEEEAPVGESGASIDEDAEAAVMASPLRSESKGERRVDA